MTLDSNIHLDYPSSRIFGHDVGIGSHFFGVERYSQKPHDKASQIKSTRSIVLWYMIGANRKQRKYLREMEIEIFETSRKNFSDKFAFYVYGDELINNEMMKGSERTAKLLIVGLGIMVLFMGQVLTRTILNKACRIVLRDFSIKQVILLTISSVGSPMLAMASTFALLGWFNVRFNSMMSISPFLVLGRLVVKAILLFFRNRS